MKNYTCITAAEWRNLCSTGRIRIHEARTVSVSKQPGQDSCHALFSMAPDRFPLGETSDFLITEHNGNQSEIERLRPPGYERGARWLLLEDVIRFFPLRADDAWAFESDAQTAQVELSDAAFESHWEQWSKAQIVDQACINGLNLMRVLGLGFSPNADANGFASWRTLAEQIAIPDSDCPDVAHFSANIIKNRDRLFDLVREDSDSSAIFVSCPIEWLNLRSHTNILESDSELAELVHRLHEKYLNVPFDPSLVCAPDLAEFTYLLRKRNYGDFEGEWTPATVSLFIRYNHKIRFGIVAPDEIVAAVRAIETVDDRQPAELLAFLLGVVLGSNKVHSLDRLLHNGRFKVAMATQPSIVLAPQPANVLPGFASIAVVASNQTSTATKFSDPELPRERSSSLESAAPESKAASEMPLVLESQKATPP
jgi:hypothetical protein